MKTIFTLVALSIFATSYADDGTVSVLKTNATVVPANCCCEPDAKLVKLAPWTVRRLNRIADRQEAREARKCCCNPCECKTNCCNKTKTIVVESRR